MKVSSARTMVTTSTTARSQNSLLISWSIIGTSKELFVYCQWVVHHEAPKQGQSSKAATLGRVSMIHVLPHNNDKSHAEDSQQLLNWWKLQLRTGRSKSKETSRKTSFKTFGTYHIHYTVLLSRWINQLNSCKLFANETLYRDHVWGICRTFLPSSILITLCLRTI